MREQGVFEMDWYFETKVDGDNKIGAYDAIYYQNATEAQIAHTVESLESFLAKFDERWSDGRSHVSGKDVTAADFNLLAFYTSSVINPGLYNPQVGSRLQMALEQMPNTKRVIENIQAPLQTAFEKLPAVGTWF